MTERAVAKQARVASFVDFVEVGNAAKSSAGGGVNHDRASRHWRAVVGEDFLRTSKVSKNWSGSGGCTDSAGGAVFGSKSESGFDFVDVDAEALRHLVAHDVLKTSAGRKAKLFFPRPVEARGLVAVDSERLAADGLIAGGGNGHGRGDVTGRIDRGNGAINGLAFSDGIRRGVEINARDEADDLAGNHIEGFIGERD